MTYRLWIGNLDGGAAEDQYALDWLCTLRERGYDDARIEPAPGLEPTFPLGDDDSERGPEEYEDDAFEIDPSETWPLPKPPRCRGIQVEENKFTGCAYGYGDWSPYAGPRDCPVCGGSGIEGGNQPN